MNDEKVSKINRSINDFFDTKKCIDLEVGKNGKWLKARNQIIPIEIRDIFASLIKFFNSRQWHNGGRIPEELIFNRRNFRLLNNISLVEAMDLATESIKKCGQLAKTSYSNYCDTRIYLKIIRFCESHGIRQDHIGGLLLLYLELCERVRILD